MDTLGVLAHRGGLLVDRPQLTVGVVLAVARSTGLELELLARRPLDRRTPAERQADIRTGRPGPSIAPRRLLPPHDEGEELRVGWLDGEGRAHWVYGSVATSSGDSYDGERGPSLETVLQLPPLYDRVSLVLAWPEIGFEESIVDLPLPDRATVERGSVSIWEAPLPSPRDVGPLRYRTGSYPTGELTVERGRIVAGPRVLHRGPDAVVVLARLTAVAGALSMELLSVARGDRAPTGGHPPIPGASVQGATVAAVRANDAVRLPPAKGWSTGGGGEFRATTEYVLARAAIDPVALLVAWPEAGLAEMCVEIPLSGDR